jgi:hypothetical protein
MRQNGIDERIGDRLDGRGLPDVGPASTKTRNGFQAVMEGGRNHFLRDGPLERSENMPNPLVDLIPTEAGVDHRLANGLEPERPELSSHRVAIELSERPESQPNTCRLRSRLAMFDVVGIGECEIGQKHFVDGEIGPGGRFGHQGTSARRQPFGDEPIVFGTTLGSVVFPEIDIATADRHDRQASRLVESVGRDAGGLCGHGTASNPVDYRLSRISGAALSNSTGKLTQAFGRSYVRGTDGSRTHI